ncbi:MAG: hypothetical protein FWD58_04095 [Firmicutes bacterium]|nr:hypothetical protein [Bacillota bacterium]
MKKIIKLISCTAMLLLCIPFFACVFPGERDNMHDGNCECEICKPSIIRDDIHDRNCECEICKPAAIDDDTLRPDGADSEFSLEDKLAVKSISIVHSEAMGPTAYNEYDFDAFTFSEWSNFHGEVSKPEIMFTFTRAQAITFLDDLEKGGMFQLEKRYYSNGIVYDGGGWSVTVKLQNGDVFTSSGWNAEAPAAIRKGMDDAVRKLGNPTKLWVSEWWEEYWERNHPDLEMYYDNDSTTGKAYPYYPGCTVRFDLKDGIDWEQGYRDENGNAINESLRLQRLVDMKNYYANLLGGLTVEMEEVRYRRYMENEPGVITPDLSSAYNHTWLAFKPEIFTMDMRVGVDGLNEHGLIYDMETNPYSPHVMVNFAGRTEDNSSKQEPTDPEYFKEVVGQLEQGLTQSGKAENLKTYWTGRWGETLP